MSYDPEIWLTEIAENIDVIKSSGCDKFFFVQNNAVDTFISRLSRDFICAEFRDILTLKDSGFISIISLRPRNSVATSLERSLALEPVT